MLTARNGRIQAVNMLRPARSFRESFSRPIDGLTVISGSGMRGSFRWSICVVPVPQAPANFGADEVGPLRDVPTPLSVTQPLGPSFKLVGSEVSWQKWNFHFRIDKRVGLVVSRVGYEDAGKLRSILYEGSLSEMFVPYQDPDLGGIFGRFLMRANLRMDFLRRLSRGGLPENAVYFEQIFADDHGFAAPAAGGMFIRAGVGRHCLAAHGRLERWW